MPRYIDADLIEPSEIIIPCGDGTYEYVEVVYMDDIREIPTADVVERKTAYLVNPNPYGTCSECGLLIDIRNDFNFCPNCGAKMDGKETEDAVH